MARPNLKLTVRAAQKALLVERFKAAENVRQRRLPTILLGTASQNGYRESIGTAERGMTAGCRDFHQALLKDGFKHGYYDSPGTAHEWQTWCRSLYKFAPLPFQTPQDGHE